MKRRIRLTEGDLHRIVKESVKRILSEQSTLYNRNTRETLEFFPRQYTLFIRSDKGASYQYYYKDGRWERDFAPDFSGLNADDLRRCRVMNPEQVLSSAQNTIEKRQQERDAQKAAEDAEMRRRAQAYVSRTYDSRQNNQPSGDIYSQTIDALNRGDYRFFQEGNGRQLQGVLASLYNREKITYKEYEKGLEWIGMGFRYPGAEQDGLY